jgi:predicted metal-dependent phosphoesterase TrpH
VLAVEFHAHTACSEDGRDPVELVLERAADRGLDALAITDHDTIEASLTAAERAPDLGLVGIPGLEVSTADGHLLALGVRELIPAGRPFAETVDLIHEAGGTAIVPHPFHESRSGAGTVVDRDTLASVDAVEVYNSRLLTGRGNRRAAEFAAEYGLPTIAGSDAHIASMVGRGVTHVDADERSAAAILEAVEAGRTEIDGRRTPWRISFLQMASGAKRKAARRIAGLLP